MRFEEHFLDDIKDRVALSEVIGRYVTWDRKSRRAAGDFWAPCPFHGEKTASFHVVDKKGRYHCFGCGVGGNHFRFLMEYSGLTFPEAVAEIAELAGVSLPDARPPSPEQQRRRAEAEQAREKRKAAELAEAARDLKRRIEDVKFIWQETKPFRGSLAETYLEWRAPGLARHIDENVRFHPSLPHPAVPDRPHPALVARVQGADGRGVGIWRIYLRLDGKGKLPIPKNVDSSAKLGLGPTSGGAVRLGGLAERIGICEGLETATAVRELGTKFPVWPALATSGIIGFQVPEGVKEIVLFADPDGDKIKFKTNHKGEEFIALPPGMNAADAFIARNPGVKISIADGARESDWLEILQNIRGLPVR